MLSKLSSCFHALARGWLILLILVAFVVFLAVTLPGVQAASGNTEGLDTIFFYTPEEAFANVASYTDDGRDTLLIFHLTADIVNPFLYASFLTLVISWLFQRGFAPESKIQRLNVIPLGAAIFDLLENICIVVMLSAYPTLPRLVAWLSTISTMTKIIFIYGSMGLVLIGLVRALMNRFQKTVTAGNRASAIKS